MLACLEVVQAGACIVARSGSCVQSGSCSGVLAGASNVCGLCSCVLVLCGRRACGWRERLVWWFLVALRGTKGVYSMSLDQSAGIEGLLCFVFVFLWAEYLRARMTTYMWHPGYEYSEY
jgi:hypothetical protein